MPAMLIISYFIVYVSFLRGIHYVQVPLATASHFAVRLRVCIVIIKPTHMSSVE